MKKKGSLPPSYGVQAGHMKKKGSLPPSYDLQASHMKKKGSLPLWLCAAQPQRQ